MHLVQLLLPLKHEDGNAVAAEEFAKIRKELASRFGGVTAFTRSPAKGVWIDDEGRAINDDLVVVEVMAQQVESTWWRDYRHELERRLDQMVIVIRAMLLTLL
jgi:hypothetical protein